MSSPASPTRNAPCPCGSGKRYKDCHGRLSPAQAAVTGSTSVTSPIVAPPVSDLARRLALDRRLLVSGLALQAEGKLAEARRDYEQVLALDPKHPDALHLLALLDLADGNAEAALDKIASAIASYPRHAPLHASHARILLTLNRRQEAVAALELAASNRMEQPQRWIVQGNGLVPPQPATSVGAASAAQLSTHEVNALLGRATKLREAGSLIEAEAALRTILNSLPHHVEALVALARLLREMLQYAEAASIYDKLPTLDAGNRDEYAALLSDCLVQIGRTDEARHVAQHALQRSPASLSLALRAKLALKPVYADVADLRVNRDRYAAGLAELWSNRPRYRSLTGQRVRDSLIWSNFYLAYQGENDLALQVAYSEFAADLLDHAVPHLRQTMPRAEVVNRRIRIGFASHYFYECSAGRYFRSWIEGLDKDAFEVFAYHVRPGLDTVGQAIKESVDHFRQPTHERFFGDVIRSDGLDILVYPELGGNGLTFLLAALRLAPIQCAGWGHPVTTGHATIDYFFSSSEMEPVDADAHYREQLVRLPGIGTDYTPPSWQEPKSMAEAREELGLPKDRKLYFFPQSIYKIHPDNDDLLAEILREDPRGLLVLFPGHTGETTDQYLGRLAARLKSQGMDVHDRVLVLPIMSRQTYMRVNAACDVMLDSLHWSGGNTSLDAFAASLPVVTLPGAFMRGRQTLGMLKSMSILDLVVDAKQAYVELATTIANDSKARCDFVERIKTQRRKLFHERAAIEAMAAFYRHILT